MGIGLLGALAGLIAVPAGAAGLTLEPIDGSYDEPTYVASDPTDPDRLIVTEQGGEILATTPTGTSLFLDLTDKTQSDGEEGLWSIAFAPDFATSRLFYVAYTAQEDSPAPDDAPALFEYREEATPAATEATERLVLATEDSAVSHNHNGGQLQFGPGGYLYWSVGDDASSANAQALSNLRGKILRIDPRDPAGLPAYSVPSDNPFTGTPGARPEIWSWGLRNPWRFSFDRLTGALTIGDVGSGLREEVNYVTQAAGGGRGANFGWPDCEGREDLGGSCAIPAFTPPVYDYTNPMPGSAAIAGGYVVRDPDLGDLYGRYLFADTFEGVLQSVDPTTSTPTDAARDEGLSADFITSFGEDSCGRIYVVAAGAHRVFRLEGPSGGACPASTPIDTDPPETSVKLKRKNRRGTKYVARIASDEPNSTFECKLDKRRWKPCEAKRKLKRLDPGRHRFRARATDAAGNTDPQPAKKRFRTKRA